MRKAEEEKPNGNRNMSTDSLGGSEVSDGNNGGEAEQEHSSRRRRRRSMTVSPTCSVNTRLAA